MTREDLPDLLYGIIKSLGGKAGMMQVFREFWKIYGGQLLPSNDLFYTWNYDIRWAATKLRKQKRMKNAKNQDNHDGTDISPRGMWEII